MNSLLMTPEACPACNGRDHRPLETVDVAEQHLHYAKNDQEAQHLLNCAAEATALRYRLLRCNNCSLEYSDPMRAPSADWYRLAYRALDLFPSDRWEFNEVIRRLPRGDQLFEFGCGSGAFLRRCKQAGVPASGMDFSADAVESCFAKGFDVSHMDLNSVNGASDSSRFPQMAAFHFLEHLEDPALLFLKAAAKAASGAHLWLTVPSDRRPTRRMGLTDFLDQPPHHMTRWTRNAFEAIGSPHGWQLAETVYEPISMGTAAWCITAYSPRYRRWESAGLFENRTVERAYRAGFMGLAVLKRLITERHMSGFSMLAHFVYKER